MTSWGNWDKEELITLPKITQQYLKAWFTVIANTPRPDSGTCSTGKAAVPLQWQPLQIIPPYPIPLSPLGLVFNLHTFMLKYYNLSLFLAAVAGKDQSLLDKWGFYQPHSLQRTWRRTATLLNQISSLFLASPTFYRTRISNTNPKEVQSQR